MSLYDVSKLTGASPLRGVGRDYGGKPASLATPQAAALAETGVSVETGSRVAAGPVPVDSDRVSMIRDALKDGSYPIMPARITDALIAARIMLSNGQ
jgi:negative regulator of flagellin synthesis FlgM